MRPPRRRLSTKASIAIVGLLYIASLVPNWWVSGSAPPLEPFDPRPADIPVVAIEMDDIHPATNELEIRVWLIPPKRYLDERLGVLNTDIVVRFYPWVNLGGIRFDEGETPASTVATIGAQGDANTWPFDSYRTRPVTADALVGSGDSRFVEPAEIRFSGRIGAGTSTSKNLIHNPLSRSLRCSAAAARWRSTWASSWYSSPCPRWRCSLPSKPRWASGSSCHR